MTQKGPPIAAQTTSCTKYTVASLGQGDKGSENGMFEDPLCCPLASMAQTHRHVRADAHCFIPGNFKKDATVRPSHGRPRGHRPTVRPSVRLSDCPFVRPSENVRVTTLHRGNYLGTPAKYPGVS
jgi:hypothetical protein